MFGCASLCSPPSAHKHAGMISPGLSRPGRSMPPRLDPTDSPPVHNGQTFPVSLDAKKGSSQAAGRGFAPSPLLVKTLSLLAALVACRASVAKAAPAAAAWRPHPFAISPLRPTWSINVIGRTGAVWALHHSALAAKSSSSSSFDRRPKNLAVGETVILLHPPSLY